MAEKVDEPQVLDNLNLVVSVDPGVKNLAIAVIDSDSHKVLFTQTYDLGWTDKTDVGRRLGEFSKKVGMVLCETQFFCKVNPTTKVQAVLIERQSQGAPFEQVEGMLVAFSSLYWPTAQVVPIHPRAVARWLPEKFKGKRAAKKSWTKKAICSHFTLDPAVTSVDECDALLNYLYFSKIALESQ